MAFLLVLTVGHTPLMMAAEKGHLDVVRYLVQQKADLEQQTTLSKTALTIASRTPNDPGISRIGP